MRLGCSLFAAAGLTILPGSVSTIAQAEPVTLTVALAANPQMETAAKLIDDFYPNTPISK
jgi:sorbitol/mannitol transport system substrate-binding protein